MPVAQLLGLALIALGQTAESQSGDSGPELPADLVLQKFTVAKDGDVLLLPVRVAGREHLFMVDTGFDRTCFDSSISLGKAIDWEMISSPTGDVKANLYGVPANVFVGSIPFRVDDAVVSLDLKRFREASGWPIVGVLGMDFLSRHVLHVNFDKGELLFLKSAPKDAGAVIPIVRDEEHGPSVAIDFQGKKKVLFRIDTGAITFNCGTIEVFATADLFRQGEFRALRTTLSTTLEGERRTSTYQGRQFMLGEFKVERPSFIGFTSANSLGMGFWSRFLATFDFPRGILYCAKESDTPPRILGTLPDSIFEAEAMT